jgi:hypothetical protein
MPTREAIVTNLIPSDVPKPIPVRVVQTKPPKLKQEPKTVEQIQAQQNINGTAPTADSVETADSVKLSPQMSALARKEQAFRQREMALNQREKELENKLAKAAQFEQLETKLKTKDFSEVEKLGGNYEDYTKYLLDKQAAEDPTSQKFQDLENKIQEMKKKQEEEFDARFEASKNEYRREIKAVVGSNPDFSSIKETENEEAVLQLILDDLDEDKETTIAEACKEIEDLLVEQGRKFTSLSKLKPAQTEAAPRELPTPRPSVKTLTNQMQPTASPPPLKPLQYMSESERYAEARRRALAKRAQQQGT